MTGEELEKVLMKILQNEVEYSLVVEFLLNNEEKFKSVDDIDKLLNNIDPVIFAPAFTVLL